jgi:hypothetical protein
MRAGRPAAGGRTDERLRIGARRCVRLKCKTHNHVRPRNAPCSPKRAEQKLSGPLRPGPFAGPDRSIETRSTSLLETLPATARAHPLLLETRPATARHLSSVARSRPHQSDPTPPRRRRCQPTEGSPRSAAAAAPMEAMEELADAVLQGAALLAADDGESGAGRRGSSFLTVVAIGNVVRFLPPLRSSPLHALIA